MPQRVEVPGHGIVEFPDNMSDEQIAAAIRKNMLVPKIQAPPQAPTAQDLVGPDKVWGGMKKAGRDLYMGVKHLPFEVAAAVPGC